MYADPQTVTYDGGNHSVSRKGSATPATLGTFTDPTGNLILQIRQNQTANRFRREVRITSKKVAADPISAINKEVSTSVIFVVDEPKWGFSDVELGHLTTSLITWLTTENRGKLYSGEL